MLASTRVLIIISLIRVREKWTFLTYSFSCNRTGLWSLWNTKEIGCVLSETKRSEYTLKQRYFMVLTNGWPIMNGRLVFSFFRFITSASRNTWIYQKIERRKLYKMLGNAHLHWLIFPLKKVKIERHHFTPMRKTKFSYNWFVFLQSNCRE